MPFVEWNPHNPNLLLTGASDSEAPTSHFAASRELTVFTIRFDQSFPVAHSIQRRACIGEIFKNHAVVEDILVNTYASCSYVS